MVTSYPVPSDNINVGAILAEPSSQRVLLRLGESSTSDSVSSIIKTLNSVSLDNTGYRVAPALKTARTDLFRLKLDGDSFGSRDDAQRVLFVFADKIIKDSLESEIFKLQQDGVKIVFVVDSQETSNALDSFRNAISKVIILPKKVSGNDVNDGQESMSKGR